MNITWNDNRTVCTDNNGNSATLSRWGTEEAAEASLATLADCRDCRDCRDCLYCRDCRDCRDCLDCRDCRDCLDCTNCTDCTGCRDCQSCIDCRDCTDCRGCLCSGVMDGCLYWVCGGMAMVGCQRHAVDEWLAFSRDDVAGMADDAVEWYDRNWEAWTALLRRFGDEGACSPDKKEPDILS